MVQFCTQFEEPVYFGAYEQQLTIGVDGASITNEVQLLTLFGDYLDINKAFISNHVQRQMFISDRLGRATTPSGIHYVGIDNQTNIFPQNARYIRFYIKNQYEQEVASITYKLKPICKSKENVVLCWYNDLAGFDTFVFDGNLKIDTNITGTSSHNKYASRNKTTDKVFYDVIIQLSAKGVTEKQIKGLESLLKSEEVYLFDIDNHYNNYKVVLNDKLIPISRNSNTLNTFETSKGIYEVNFSYKILEANA